MLLNRPASLDDCFFMLTGQVEPFGVVVPSEGGFRHSKMLDVLRSHQSFSFFIKNLASLFHSFGKIQGKMQVDLRGAKKKEDYCRVLICPALLNVGKGEEAG